MKLHPFPLLERSLRLSLICERSWDNGGDEWDGPFMLSSSMYEGESLDDGYSKSSPDQLDLVR
jgi:hypothetical protein